MKKNIVIMILIAAVFTLISCGEQESPAAYLPSIRCDGTSLQTFSVLISSSDGQTEADGYGAEYTPSELVSKFINSIPFTDVQSNNIEFVNGSDKNAEFSISYVGVYKMDGEELKTEEAGLKYLGKDKYIICARTTEKKSNGAYSNSYIFAGINRK